MANLKITLACWNYDRTRGLMDGSIRPERVDLTYRMAFVAEIFERMVRNQEFEVSELGLTFYLRSLELEDPPFIAIPVFPLRFFRHAAVFVNARRAASPRRRTSPARRSASFFATGTIPESGRRESSRTITACRPTATPTMSATSTIIRCRNGTGCRSTRRRASASIISARARRLMPCSSPARSTRSIRRSSRNRC